MISLFLFWAIFLQIVLRDIQFDHQFCLMTVKIYNIRSNNPLSIKSNGIV